MTENKENLPAKPKFELMALSAHDLFAKVAGEETWMKEIGFGLQILRGNTTLQEVTRTAAGAESIKNAIANVALCGTTLNPVLGKAYLVPRKVGGVMMCCLDMSYKGLAGIAMDSGSIKHIAPRLVYDFEKFEYWEQDGDQHIKHTIELNPPEEATKPANFWKYLVCGYVIVTLHDGSKIITNPLPKWKIKKAMDTSKTTGEYTPWRTHPDEQALKTLVKHAYKLLPQTDRMSQAVTVLNEHEGLEIKERGQRVNETLSRFADAEDATFTDPSETVIDNSTGEVISEHEAPKPCEKCQQTGNHAPSCPDNEPPTEGQDSLFKGAKK